MQIADVTMPWKTPVVRGDVLRVKCAAKADVLRKTFVARCSVCWIALLASVANSGLAQEAFAQSANANGSQSANAKPLTNLQSAPRAVGQKARTKYPSIKDFAGLHFSKSLPTNFPLPPYPNNVVSTNFSNSTAGQPTAAASIVTKDAAEVVFKWYQDYCRKDNWLIRTPSAKTMQTMGKQGQLFILNAIKGKQEIYLYCTKNPKKALTNVSISWFLNKQAVVQ